MFERLDTPQENKTPTATETLHSKLTGRITYGDCITEMAKLPERCVDFILTDPPYIAHYKDRDGRKIQNDDNSKWVLPAFAQAYRLLKPDAFCVSFYGWNKVDVFLSTWKQCGFRPVGHFIWTKQYASSCGYTKMCHECAYLLIKGLPEKPKTPILDVLSWRYSGNEYHPTQKPVSALEPLIRAYCPDKGIVLDPFAGSATTGIAANRCGRRFVLFEKDFTYYKAAVTRLQNNG